MPAMEPNFALTRFQMGTQIGADGLDLALSTCTHNPCGMNSSGKEGDHGSPGLLRRRARRRGFPLRRSPRVRLACLNIGENRHEHRQASHGCVFQHLF